MARKHAVITGGADGLGKEFALLYVKKGYKVTVLDIDTQLGTSLAQLHNTIHFLQCDLGNFHPNILNKIHDKIDVLICNAGISVSGDFRNIPKQKEERVMHINTLSHMELIKELLKKDVIQNGGSICCIISATAFLPFPIALGYSASKSALDGFAKALRSFLYGKNISVTCCYPGPMKTHHKQYYEDFDEGKGLKPSLIALKTVRAIQKRKRSCYPDITSKVLRIASVLFPKTLIKLTYKKYKNVCP